MLCAARFNTEASMRTIVFGATLLATLAALPAQAAVNVTIDLATQRMHVESSTGTYDWPVSTARAGYVTPTGSFRPERLMEVYHSKKYDNAPMPHAIFFYYGFAIHGTNEVRHLGQPASHGCVRLAPGNATKLFTMVKAEGASITITGTPPGLAGATAMASAAPSGRSGGIFSFLGL